MLVMPLINVQNVSSDRLQIPLVLLRVGVLLYFWNFGAEMGFLLMKRRHAESPFPYALLMSLSRHACDVL